MTTIVFSEDARKDLRSMNKNEQAIFVKHARKLAEIGPRRHLRHGLPHFVDNVDKDGRMPYNWENETLYILRCFTDHKEYDKWYKSYKK